jgi:hypothetical protein
MAGRSALARDRLPQASAVKRRVGPRGKNCARCMERAIRRRLAPHVGNGRLWVVRRPLRDGRYATERFGRHGQRDGPGSRMLRPQKGGAILGPRGDQKGGRLWPAPVLPSVSYQPGDASCWEDSARRPDAASALRVCCGTRPAGWFCNAPAPFRVGSRRRRWTATTARSVAATASRVGWRARVRRVGRSRGKGPLTARPDRQAVGALSMIRPLLGQPSNVANPRGPT